MSRTPSRSAQRRGRRLVVAGGMTLSLALVAVAAGTWAWNRYANVERVDVDLAAVSKEGPSNYLVVGSDTRAGIEADAAGSGAFLDGVEGEAGHRSDTLMVVRVDPSKKQASLLSVPRDLWVQIDGEGHRINAAYNDGPQAVIDAVQENLDIPVHHYVEVDFVAFQRLVEAVDGVPLYINRPVRDRNSGLNIEATGCITVDPYQALAFSRSRHLEYQEPDGTWRTDPTGDLGRVTRQQIFIRRAMAQVSTLGLGDVGAFDTLGSTLTESVTLDQDLSLRTVAALARRFKDFTPDDLATSVVPTTDETMPSGAQVQMLDEAAAPSVLAPFRGTAPQTGGSPEGVSPKDVSFELLNGTGRDGFATALSDEFARFGFVPTGVGNPPGGTTDASEIHFPEGARPAAELAAGYFTTPVDLVEDSAVADGSIQLIIGTDFDRFDRPAAGGAAADTTAASGDGASSTAQPEATEVGGADAPSTTAQPPPAEPQEPVGVAVGDPPPGVSCP